MTPGERFASKAILLIALGLMLAALVDLVTSEGDVRVSVETPAPTLAPARLADLLSATTDRAEEVGRDVAEARAHGGSDAIPSSRYSDEAEAGVGAVRSSVSLTPAAVASAVAFPLSVLSATSSPYAELAACRAACWGEQLTRAEVEALALEVTGDVAWSAWAGRCFTGGGENRGYVGAVGGPNRDGTYDLGLGQNNTDTLTWLGYDHSLVLSDPRYALEALYATWLAQGYGAWMGC